MEKIRLSTEKKKIQVTEDELVNQFKGITRHQLVSVTVNTEPKLNQKGRVSGMSLSAKLGTTPEAIVKVSKYVGNIAFDYAKSMENALVKEGKESNTEPVTYVPKESWHQPYEGSAVIREHKTNGGKYFYIKVGDTNNEPKIEYYDTKNHSIIPVEDMEEFLAPSYPSKVNVRLPKIENIVEISACGKVYEVI